MPWDTRGSIDHRWRLASAFFKRPVPWLYLGRSAWGRDGPIHNLREDQINIGSSRKSVSTPKGIRGSTNSVASSQFSKCGKAPTRRSVLKLIFQSVQRVSRTLHIWASVWKKGASDIKITKLGFDWFLQGIRKCEKLFFYLTDLYIKFDIENTSKLTITSKLGAILFWRQKRQHAYTSTAIIYMYLEFL
jgi:hypothetical protein